MAVVFEDALKKDLTSGKLKSIYILFGDDGFLKKSYSDKIAKQISSPDDIFNYCKFGENVDLQEVYDAVMQMPFASDKKYVELCDYDFEHAAKADFEKLCSLISDVPDTTVLVVRFDNVEADYKKNAKFKKIVEKAEKAEGAAVRLDHKKAPELIKMLIDGAAKRGCKFESSAARYLVETAGEDINLLRNELSKLCAFSKSITKETVDTVCVKTVEASVYNLSKYILDCNSSKALTCLDELFFMRIEPMIILYAVSSVYIDMFRIFASSQNKVTLSEVAKIYGYKGREFVLEKAAVSLKKFDFNKLNLSLSALTQADKSLKSFGADQRIILEQLVIRLIYIIVKGESIDKA